MKKKKKNFTSPVWAAPKKHILHVKQRNLFLAPAVEKRGAYFTRVRTIQAKYGSFLVRIALPEWLGFSEFYR